MMQSISPLTGKKYPIPKALDHKEEIDDFLFKNKGKKVIVVQGLGFVGAVMSLVCANSAEQEYAVIGIDLPDEKNFWKICSLNEGIFPLTAEDPKIKEFYERALENNNFFATYDAYAFTHADVVIVDVNLDVKKNSNTDFSLNSFDVDLSGFKKAIQSIGKNINENTLILVETTVPPGTCKEVVMKILDEELLARNIPLDKYFLGHSYERVMPGPEYINSIKSYPRVFAGINSESAEKVLEFLKTIIDIDDCELTKLDSTNASEMAKVLENSYRASNISFIVEWTRFAERAGVNLYEVINAIRVRKTHSNIMYPGIGVGGYCLTKDPLLASWSNNNFFESTNPLSISEDSVSNNDQMPRYAYKRLLEEFGPLSSKKVLFLGVSYRGDVGDTRFSPVEGLYKLILKDNAEILLHDPYIKYWEETNIEVSDNFDELINLDPEIVIFSSGHTIYRQKDFINKLINAKSMFIFDTIGHLYEDQLERLSSEHKVSVLGRGDLNTK